MVISNSKFPERGRIKKKVVYPVIFLRTVFFSSVLELKLIKNGFLLAYGLILEYCHSSGFE